MFTLLYLISIVVLLQAVTSDRLEIKCFKGIWMQLSILDAVRGFSVVHFGFEVP